MRNGVTASIVLLFLGCSLFGQDFKIIQMDGDSLGSLPNPVKSLIATYRNATSDLSIVSGPIENSIRQKFSIQVLSELGFDLAEESERKVLLRNCGDKSLFEVSSYFGGGPYFVISYKKFSDATAKRIPYLSYGCN